MRSTVFLLVFCSAAHSQQSGVEGIIVDAVTGKPLPGVHLMTYGLAVGSSEFIPGEAYGATSGKDGHFSIGNMKPSVYMLAPQLAGYVQVPSKDGNAWSSLTMAIKAGETLKDFRIEMTPKAFLSGRVTDENGDPVQRAELLAVPAAAGTPESLTGRIAGQTDERGQFRIAGAPGKYYVQVTAGRMANHPNEVRSDGTQTPAYAITWYPGTAGKSSAAVVETLPGRDAAGIDIRLVRQQAFSIHGTVSGVPSGGRAFVLLYSGDEIQQQLMNTRSAAADADGKFSFTALTPGAYNVSARFENSGTPMRSQLQAVRLESGDVMIPTLRLEAGEELPGTVEGIADGNKDQRTIRLDPLLPLQRTYGKTPAGEITPDGKYRIAPVFAGKYRVKIEPLPDGSYIKSVRLDAAEAAEGIVDLSRGVGGAHMKVLLSGKAGVVEGTVLDPPGKLSKTPFMIVILAENPDDLGPENMKQVMEGAKYSFRNVRPGKYRLFASDPMFANGKDAMKTAFEKAEPIEIKEGDRLTRDLVVGGKEAARGK